MRGQQLSGTRKLNKHWQSGTPGEKIVRLTGIQSAIRGFDLSGYPRSGDPADFSLDYGRFGDQSSRNIIVANEYKLWTPSGLTIKSTDNVDVIWGDWYVKGGGGSGPEFSGNWEIRTKRLAFVENMPVWKYGKIKGEPHFCYYKRYVSYPAIFDESTEWEIQTRRQYGTTYDINQNGISESTAMYWSRSSSGYSYVHEHNYSLEDAYANTPVKVLIPYYEIIAMPYRSVGSGIRTEIAVFGDDVNTTFSNDITCIGDDFERTGMNIVYQLDQEIWGSEYFLGKETDNNYYISTFDDSYASIVGAISGGFASNVTFFGATPAFPGDKTWHVAKFPLGYQSGLRPTYPIPGYAYGVDRLLAGTYNGEDMFYFWRLDHLECETVSIPSIILPFTPKLAPGEEYT